MIRKLNINDTKQFSDLIINMYSNLENLEWFSPMPFDEENVKSMIEDPRFYIIGYFDNNKLCAVGSLDYKCGKLIGKIDFPSNCNTNKLVEVAFHMVHSDHRGNGIMKKLLAFLLKIIKQNGFEWVFGKVNKNNFASLKSLIKMGFYEHADFAKPVKIKDFKKLSSEPFFSKIGKENAKKTLSKYDENSTEIIADYKIMIKQL